MLWKRISTEERSAGDEKVPEVSFDSCRVLQDKDGQVLDDGHGQKEVDLLEVADVLPYDLDIAEHTVEGSEELEHDFGGLTDGVVGDGVPAARSHQFVDQGPVVVGAVLLVPDDGVEQWGQDEDDESWRKHSYHLCWRHLINFQVEVSRVEEGFIGCHHVPISSFSSKSFTSTFNILHSEATSN